MELFLRMIIRQALQASHAHIDLTKKLKDSGKLLDIQVLDHIIMASEAY